MDTDTTDAALFACDQYETITNLDYAIRELTLVRDIVATRDTQMTHIETAHRILMDTIGELSECLQNDVNTATGDCDLITQH